MELEREDEADDADDEPSLGSFDRMTGDSKSWRRRLWGVPGLMPSRMMAPGRRLTRTRRSTAAGDASDGNDAAPSFRQLPRGKRGRAGPKGGNPPCHVAGFLDRHRTPLAAIVRIGGTNAADPSLRGACLFLGEHLACQAGKAARQLLNEKRPQLLDRAGGRHFLPVCLHDARERWIRPWATLQVPRDGPTLRFAGLRRPFASSTTLRVLFTIGQMLPDFPALIRYQGARQGTHYALWLFE
jgi:hypothetical protein